MLFRSANVVVPPSNIHLREVFFSFQFVDEGVDEGKVICIPDSVFIEVSIVLARAQSSILLLKKEEGRGLR